MSAHDWFVEHRTSHVVRTLEPDEERVFREHLAGCDECRREVELIGRELAWLPMGAAPSAPRPGLVHRLTEAAVGRRTPRLPRLAVAAVAASVVVALGSLAWAQVTVQRVEDRASDQRRGLEQALTMVRDTLGIIRSADRVRHAVITLDRQQGGMVLFADDRSHRWNVVVYGIVMPSPAEVLQFWFITEKGMVRGVEVKSPREGPAFLTMGMPPAGGRVVGAALTMEPPVPRPGDR
jgi:Anti-sigma-K factor rskA, C-terminal/Putative zinc-finger